MFSTNRKVYTAILVVAACASLLQIGLMGNGFTKSLSLTASEIAPVQLTQAPVKDVIENGFTPEQILIPEANINLKVYSVPLVDGTWKVFPTVANYAEGTNLVNNKTGNVGLYAHDTASGFARIKRLLTGSDIIVVGKDQMATYKVTSYKVIQPTDVNVFDTTKAPTLTLVTCDGVFSQQRYVVKAALVKIEKAKK
jgi:LPXTG-site transpeptidase (sortase) family protein